jgi:hypothetical protein
LEQHPVRYVVGAILLIATTVAIHGAGTLLLVRLLLKRQVSAKFGYVRSTLATCLIVVALLVIHLAEVFIWAVYYESKGCVPDLMTGIYFSLTTYSTLGYGDVVLRSSWRILAGIESLVGLLMIGWSTALLIRAVGWINARLLQQWGVKLPEQS